NPQDCASAIDTETAVAMVCRCFSKRRHTMRPMIVLVLGCALACTSCGRLFKRAEAPITLNSPRIGAQAPETDGQDFAGTRFKLSDYRGKVVVVSFWAST